MNDRSHSGYAEEIDVWRTVRRVGKVPVAGRKTIALTPPAHTPMMWAGPNPNIRWDEQGRRYRTSYESTRGGTVWRRDDGYEFLTDVAGIRNHVTVFQELVRANQVARAIDTTNPRIMSGGTKRLMSDWVTR